MKIIPALVTGAGVMLLAAAAHATTIISTFDSDLDGWTTDNLGTFQQQAAGGDPGGYLYLDNDENIIAHIFAPPKFLGDLSGLDGGFLGFSGNLVGNGGTFWENVGDDYGVVWVAGPAGTASVDLFPNGATAPFQEWLTISVSFDAATWGKTQAEWTDILSNVTQVGLNIEALFGNEIEGIDNFRIEGERIKTGVPEPGTLGVFGLALAGLGYSRRRRAR